MKLKILVFGLILSTIISVGCKRVGHDSKLSFDFIEDSKGLLYSKVFQSTLTICLKKQASKNDLVLNPGISDIDGETSNLDIQPEQTQPSITFEQLRQDLPRAVNAWVEPLRSLVNGEGLVSEVNVIIEGCSDNPEENLKISDLSVYFVERKDPTAYGIYHFGERNNGRAIQIFLAADYPTVLHEVGHAFGLDDTYEKFDAKCKFGQPTAVMCLRKGRHEVLQSDDVDGVQNKFCTIHSERFPACNDLLSRTKAGMRANVDEDGRAIVKIGLSLEDAHEDYYSYSVYDLSSNFGPDFPVLVAMFYSKKSDGEDYLKVEHEKKYGVGNVRISKSQENFTAARITRVTPGSPADRAGLKSGMYLGLIERNNVDSKAHAIELMKFVHTSPLSIGVAEFVSPTQSFLRGSPLRSPTGLWSPLQLGGWRLISVYFD